MSEFFKALEQAERDRARESQTDATSAPPADRATQRQDAAPPPEPVVVEPIAAKQAAPESAAAEAVAAEPVAQAPAVQAPAVAEPVVAKRTAAAVEPVAPRQSPPTPAAPERKAAAQAVPAVPAQPVTAQPAAPKPAAAKPVKPQPPAAKPAPAFSMPTPSPASVFRPSLRMPEQSPVTGRLNGRRPVLVALTDPSSIEADAYRTLRANIELMSNGTPSRHVAITSAAGGDGKSTTASNLAVVAAQAGRRACLVDADLRRPTLHEVFGLSNIDGLAQALEHGRPLQEVAKSVDIPNLSVVVAGRGAQERYHDLLTAQRLQKILAGSETAYDFVIFDSPPIVVSDALNLASVSDGVVIVVRAGSIPFNVLQRAIGQVNQVKGRVLGVLLNQADLRTSGTDSYRYYRAYHSTRAKG